MCLVCVCVCWWMSLLTLTVGLAKPMSRLSFWTLLAEIPKCVCHDKSRLTVARSTMHNLDATNYKQIQTDQGGKHAWSMQVYLQSTQLPEITLWVQTCASEIRQSFFVLKLVCREFRCRTTTIGWPHLAKWNCIDPDSIIHHPRVFLHDF